MSEPPQLGDVGEVAFTGESKKELALNQVLLIELSILIASFIAGRALERIRFKWMGEAGAALLLGLVVGLIMKGAHVDHNLAHNVEFKGDIFFYVLLPTIMFDAGYALDARVFLRNVGSVSLFAFAGTTISCFVVGLIMWAFGLAGWCTQLSLLENLTFGALISATDPVTVLAVFQRLNAQDDIYMNVFGESVLNDAVGLVLYEVITTFLEGKPVTGPNVLAGIGIFFGIFAGSMAIGLAVGFLASLIFRSRFFYSGEVVDPLTGKVLVPKGNSLFEVGCAIIFAYAAYLIADVAHCSGIVAVVTNGMVMNLYVRPNLSHEAEVKIEYFFKVLAALFELFVFCYIGSTLFLGDQHYSVWSYTALCLIALAVSRFANIYPLSWLTNILRPKERRITQKEQFMLWWSGLRGAMAFALAVKASEDYGEVGQIMKTVTFYIIFITVLWNGGSAAYMLELLHLRACDPPANKYAAAAAAAKEAEIALSAAVAAEERKQRYNGGKGYGGGGGGKGDDGAGGSSSSSGRGEPQVGIVLDQELAHIEEDLAKGRFHRVSKSLTAADQAGLNVDNSMAEEQLDAGSDAAQQQQRPPFHSGSLQQQPPSAQHAAVSVSGGSGAAGAPAVGAGPGTGNASSRHPARMVSARSYSSFSNALKRVQSINDGRLVDRFEKLDRKLSKILVHPSCAAGHGRGQQPGGPATHSESAATPLGHANTSPLALTAAAGATLLSAETAALSAAADGHASAGPAGSPRPPQLSSAAGGALRIEGIEGAAQQEQDRRPLAPEDLPLPPVLERITSETGI